MNARDSQVKLALIVSDFGDSMFQYGRVSCYFCLERTS
uniref:Uncharacterized protein n=1 Tax=Candidatus Kentrum sp. TC TaxID=2126339 RepID=A0A450YZR4_9GAMM|nr:MAG: hypothetical protein BECKTC1821D_GA0114238_103913 [Candidatus Kentron sp. TC]